MHRIKKFPTLFLLTAFALISTQVFASESKHEDHQETGAACEGFGPQTPRDIDQKSGENPLTFALASPYNKMNLCNIHLHNNAEHKARDFAIYAGEGVHGHGGGYQCAMSKKLTSAELVKPAASICKGLKPGDTIEVHWVYSSCDVSPGKGLESCSSERCVNPDLRVETQVFTLVNDPSALNFNDFNYKGAVVDGFHQTASLPSGTGKAVEFLGSTTGTKYSEQSCSPLQVTWNVRPQCAKLDINSIGKWCAEDNVFDEKYAHGVRKLVTNPKLLSKIK